VSARPTPPHEVHVERLLSGRVFDVVRARLAFPSGLAQDLVLVEHPGAVAIAAVDARGELVLVRQYRHAAREVLLEVPAGRLEPGEAPLAAARRELAEETGHTARQWRALASFLPAPGICSEVIHLFEARGLERGTPSPDADEELELTSLPPAQVLAVARDAKTLLAAALLLLQR
jgi:ADP-ribose pyrophosphatase